MLQGSAVSALSIEASRHLVTVPVRVFNGDNDNTGPKKRKYCPSVGFSCERARRTPAIEESDSDTTLSSSTSSTLATSPSKLQFGTTKRRRRGPALPQSSPMKTNPITGTDMEVIEIIDEENDLSSAIRNAFPRSQSHRPANQSPDLQILGINADTDLEDSDVSITFSNEDYANEYELPEILKQLSIAHEAQQEEDHTKRVEIPEYKTPNFSCAAGKSVELQDGTFMRIKSVAQNGLGDVFVRGCVLDADSTARKNNDGEVVVPRISDCRSRRMWRGGDTKLGGSQTTVRYTYNVEDDRLEGEEIQSYTYGDAFCGAGGASRGALDSGMSVRWGFDMNESAIKSYAANFAQHGTECLHESVHDFVAKNGEGGKRRVDVLHASPPCQTFSWAKTVMTPEQDEKNEAVLFSIGQLVEVVKPRVVTMEETDGLVSLHRAWFDALVHIFVHLGYSVAWKVLRCEEYGVPQSRKRLVIIAAGPGEKLPSFPTPTHGDRSLLKERLVTIQDRIQHIEPGDPDHNLDTVHEFDSPRVPFDANTLAKTLTGHGGLGNYHPSGLRHYTLRESASLQTFPKEHSFSGAGGMTATRLQIGNAVPPAFGKAIFSSIVRSLSRDDEEILRAIRDALVLD
ncbi:hypothetical protein DV738_g2209, partial [Chaetothyriales sp. CBS 135597]